MQIKNIVRKKRKQYGESQTEFGKRFNVSHATVSHWETGKYDVPNRVLEELLGIMETKCSYCNGTGILYIYAELSIEK